VKLGHILIIVVLFLTATIVVSVPSYHPKPSEPKTNSVNPNEITPNSLNVTIELPFLPPYHPKPSKPKTYSNPTEITAIPSNVTIVPPFNYYPKNQTVTYLFK
jgi:hypothetical protein